MDIITKIKTSHREEQRKQLIPECRNSGMTVSDWCEKNNLSVNAYYYWLRKIRKSILSESLPITRKESADPVVFAPLEIEEKATQGNDSVIIRIEEISIEIKETSSPKALFTALLAIKNLC